MLIPRVTRTFRYVEVCIVKVQHLGFHIPLLYWGEDLIWEFMFILGILKTFGLLSILAWEMNMRLNLISILDLYVLNSFGTHIRIS